MWDVGLSSGPGEQPQPAQGVVPYPLPHGGFLGLLEFPFPPQMHLVRLPPQDGVHGSLFGMFLRLPPGGLLAVPFPFGSIWHLLVVSVDFLLLQQRAREI